MKKYNNDIPYEVMLFDVRIIFLITALNTSTRQTVKTKLNGDECLVKILENISIQCEQRQTIKGDDTTLACEVLKALFNLYIHLDDTTEEEEKNKNLVSILYKLLLLKCEKEDDLQSNVANLLTVIPYDCYSTIIPLVFKLNLEQMEQKKELISLTTFCFTPIRQMLEKAAVNNTNLHCESFINGTRR